MVYTVTSDPSNAEEECYLLGPGSLGELRIEHLGPPVQTLDLSLAGEEGGNLLPVLASVNIHCLAKNNVLVSCK